MSKLFIISILVAITLSSYCEELPAKLKAPIYRVALFKNGLAVVNRIGEMAPTEQESVLDSNILPIDGTLFLNNPRINIEGKFQKALVDNQNIFENVEESFANQIVTVTLYTNNNDSKILRGTFVKMPKAINQISLYTNPNYIPQGRKVIALKSDKDGKTTYFYADQISNIEGGGFNQKIEKEQPVLTFVKNSPDKELLNFSYLTKGATWAPSYKAELISSSKLNLTMNAVIKNELEDLKDVEFILISGYPNIINCDKLSLLLPQVTLQAFLGGNPNQYNNYRMAKSPMMMNQRADDMVMAESASQDYPITEGDGSSDILYRNVGKKSIAKNGSLFFNIDNAENVDFKRVVEWNVTPIYNVNGYAPNRNNNDMTNQENPREICYDAISFKNPFKEPTTTAPISIFDGNKFLAQNQINWVNPEQDTLIKITKALSIKANIQEYELPKSREEGIYLWSYRYYRTNVEAILNVKNYRQSKANMIVNFDFCGKFIESTLDGKVNILADSVTNVNPQSRMNLEFELQAGEEKEIKVKYSVLVRY